MKATKGARQTPDIPVPPNTTFLLDSGAFSAKYIGVKIKLSEYVNFIRRYAEKFEGGIINLDVLDDGPQSYENWKRLHKAGINSIPVYHIGTDEDYLRRYLDETDYVCVGAIAKLDTKARIYGLDNIWNKYLLDDGGIPKCKVHGLGLTSPKIVQRYPWYSVDSAVCIKAAFNGSILIPKLMVSSRVSEPDYSKLRSLAVSDQRAYNAGTSTYFALSTGGKDLIRGYCRTIGYELPDSIEGRVLRPRRSKKGEKSRESLYSLDIDTTTKPQSEDIDTLSSSYRQRQLFNFGVFNRFQDYLMEARGGPIVYHVMSSRGQFNDLFSQCEKDNTPPMLLVSYHALNTKPVLLKMIINS